MKSNLENFYEQIELDRIKISKELSEVQSLMPIDPDDRERLKASIKKEGKIREPLKGYYDKKGDYFYILSGINRWQIAKELGFKSVPIDFLEDLDTEEKRTEFSISDNFDRRQLTNEQKQRLVAYFIKQSPELSNRQIAKKTKTDHKTAGKVRSELESRGEIPHVKTKDTKGRVVGEKPKKDIPKVSLKQNPKNKLKSNEQKDLNPVVRDLLQRFGKLRESGKSEIFRFPENDFSTLAKDLSKKYKMKNGNTVSTREKYEREYLEKHLKDFLLYFEGYMQIFSSLHSDKYLLYNLEKYLESRGWKK